MNNILKIINIKIVNLISYYKELINILMILLNDLYIL
jgi:hypothetical protein